MAVLPTGIGPVTGYNIERSLRFNSADSAYLNRTPASAGNRKTWTWSGWVKRGSLSASIRTVFSAGTNTASARGLIDFNDTHTLRFGFNDGTTWYIAETTAVFRDPSAWYHVVIKCDLTNGTQANRMIGYVNNVQQTTNSVSWPNADQVFNNNVFHGIGRNQGDGTYYNDGYLTEINFIDGQALTPSDFGETDSATGVWKPKAYSGTYGTNGFFLKFADNSGTTSTTLGKDSSGNGNNWTPNNFSVTAGAGNDSLVDTPTNYGTDTGVGGEVRGNYATWNPLRPSGATLTNGNLDATTGNSGSSNSGYLTATFWMPTSGKYYYEVTPTNVNEIAIGLTTDSNNRAAIYYRAGDVYINGSVSFTGSSYTNNDVIGVAVDMDALTIRFYKNNTAQGSGTSSLSAMTGPFVPAIVHLSGAGSAVAVANFGQRAFAYTAPSGFKALCTQNLPTPTIGATSTTQANDYFDATLYTGNGANNRTISSNLTPDFVWMKDRTNAYSHILIDSVRGTGKYLRTNGTNEENWDGNIFPNSGPTTNGFIVDGVSNVSINANGDSYVGWQWKANGAGSTNTAGTITSTVSANTTSGFSIVTFTGTGANATVGHGLGVAPSMYIVKNRPFGGSWGVYHTSIGATNRLLLNGTNASTADSGFWNNTAPTSTVFSVGNDGAINRSGDSHVAYCFAPVAGYSAFGSYVGSGATDGSFIYTGFRPAFVMVKAYTPSGENWGIYDNKRDGYNIQNKLLYPNLSNAENAATNHIDLLSNGFKFRSGNNDLSGYSYIYAAFAESPFKYSLAR